jgi:hypothetical protein
MSKQFKEVRQPGHDAGNAATRIRDGGLRYQSKATGSPYARDLGMMLSCFLCGRHRPRAALMSRKLIGRHQNVCADGCSRG